MARISVSDLEKIREKHKNECLVFASGGFDLMHAGHVLFFEDCKEHGDVLVVMLGSDAIMKKEKGDLRPIFNEHMRLKMVDSLKPVDYVFLAESTGPDKHPQYFLDVVMGALKPDVYVINEDASAIPYRKEFMKNHPYTKLVILPRSAPPEFDAVSTTKIIEKIKKIP